MSNAAKSTRLLGTLTAILALGGCTCIKRCAYEGFGRDGWQQPERVIEALAIQPGDRVADLGAGGGYFTFRLADAVGEAGQVYAVDVDASMLEYLDGRIEREERRNVATVRAAYEDPKLPEPVDLIFTSNTYHHIQERAAYFERAQRYLKPGGRVAIVEYKPRGFFQRIFPHSTEGADIVSEMESAGYRLERDHDFLERQSFLVFAPDES